MNCDSDEARLDAKKNAPAALSESWNRRKSQSANSDCTTKPPPNESKLNRAARRSTAFREVASGCLGGDVSPASVPAASGVLAYSQATSAPTAAYTTNTARSVEAFATLHQRAKSSGRPTASAPSAPEKLPITL